MRAAKVDANQREVVAALRACGAYVRVITQGDGLPDLLVGYGGHTVLMELKDGNKPLSARALTPAEHKFHSEWTGGLCKVINSVDEALTVLKELK